MKTIKITRPQYVGILAPMIQAYWNKINVHKLNHITYETLYTYFANTVQFGGDIAEFWVCLDDEDKPVGFALWSILPTPYVGSVYLHHIFKSTKNHQVAILLFEQFVEFGKKHHAPFYLLESVDKKTAKTLDKLAKEVGIDFIETEQTHLIGRIK